MTQFRKIVLMSCGLLLAGCATAPKPSPDILDSAEQGIAAAERAGAAELAPVELRFAREKLAAARANFEAEEYDDARWLVEQSEINSELAIEQSRAAQSRRRVNELRRSNEILREELQANFGEDFQ
jgi:hypothetical protein